MKKNYYIIAKVFRSVFWASVLSTLAYQITTLTDGIIVSRLVNADAFSAVGLSLPIINFLLLLSTIIIFGATLLTSNMIGEQKYHDAGQMFVLVSGVLVVLYSVLSAFLLIFSDEVVSFITQNERLQPFVAQYLPIQILNLPVLVIYLMLDSFVKLAGKPSLVTKSVLVTSCVNVVLDILFIGVFKMGIAGAAWATVCADIIGILCYVPYLKSDNCFYHFSIPNVRFITSNTLNTFKSGLPYGINNISISILMIGLNAIVLKVAGADGVFVLTVGIQMMMVCSLFTTGADNAILTIGGELLGEKDIDGYRRLITSAIKTTFTAILTLSIILILFPDLLPKVFGATGTLLEQVKMPLIYFSLTFPPLCIFTLRFGSFAVLQYKTMSNMHSIGMTVFILGCMYVSAIFFPQHLWPSYALSLGLILGLSYISSWLYTVMTKKDLHRLTLIPKHSEYPSISYAAAYDEIDIQSHIKEFEQFLNRCEYSDELCQKINFCLRELCSNVLHISNLTSKTRRRRKNRYFDMRIVSYPDGIVLSIKDDNCRFNPIYRYDPNVKEEELKLIITDEFCGDINYTYMNRVNCTYLRFPKY